MKSKHAHYDAKCLVLGLEFGLRGQFETGHGHVSTLKRTIKGAANRPQVSQNDAANGEAIMSMDRLKQAFDATQQRTKDLVEEMARVIDDLIGVGL
jgi:hypothetical protein